jgi:hypothetical protein
MPVQISIKQVRGLQNTGAKTPGAKMPDIPRHMRTMGTKVVGPGKVEQRRTEQRLMVPGKVAGIKRACVIGYEKQARRHDVFALERRFRVCNKSMSGVWRLG